MAPPVQARKAQPAWVMLRASVCMRIIGGNDLRVRGTLLDCSVMFSLPRSPRGSFQKLLVETWVQTLGAFNW